jgi:glucose-6-phosphate 1-dehydrogenase
VTDAYQTIIIFGATGDLAHRMLFPSLYNLYVDRLLPDDVQIIASGRSALDDQAFRASIELQ